MATFVFHNNLHRSNHHTVPLSGFPDSASDPIASNGYPFLGVFHNNFYDENESLIGSSNSLEWYSYSTTTRAYSSTWELANTTYTTVNSNSANWSIGESVYGTLQSLSSNWVSYSQTVNTNAPYWNSLIDGYNLYTNQAQQNTRQKTVSTLNINPDDLTNITWDLTAGQVAFMLATRNAFVSGFSGAKRGGIYHLSVFADDTCNKSLSVLFNPEKFAIQGTNTISKSGVNLIKLQFLSDGDRLLGKHVIYDFTPPVDDQYYSSSGIVLYSNGVPASPLQINPGESLTPVLTGGIIVDGVAPFTGVYGITVNVTDFSTKVLFQFTGVNALSADAPYRALGSMDRIDIIRPNIRIVSPTQPTSSVELSRCQPFSAIDVRTKAYGYISQLVINGVETKDFVFKPNGYPNHEMGHYIVDEPPNYRADRVQIYSVKYEKSAPVIPTLSAGIALWLNAMDYSSVAFANVNNLNYITSLSSCLPNSTTGNSNTVVLSSLSSSYIEYNTTPKQSFKYTKSGAVDSSGFWAFEYPTSTTTITGFSVSTNPAGSVTINFGDTTPSISASSGASSSFTWSPANEKRSSFQSTSLVLSGNRNAVTFTVFTPKTSGAETEWVWANGNYGIFKIANGYSIGVGTSGDYFEYNYGVDNVNKPMCVGTRYLSESNAQAVYINGSTITGTNSVTANFFDSQTTIGALNPSTGFGKFDLHELIIYGVDKTEEDIQSNVNYLLDKWKFL